MTDIKKKVQPEEELRYLPLMSVELRSSDSENGRTIEGYCACFNQQSELIYGEFREILLPSCFDEALKACDVIATINHNKQDVPMARYRTGYSSNSLELSVDSKGLKFKFEAPDTARGTELLEAIKRGDLDGCSFVFRMNYSDANAERWEKLPDGTYLRYINTVKSVHDVSIVLTPAYSQTEVSARSLDSFNQYKGGSTEGKEDEQREKTTPIHIIEDEQRFLLLDIKTRELK